MKKLVKIAISICLCVACVFSVLSLSACGDNNLINYEVTVSIDGTENKLTFTLDKEVAPKTVEQISKLIDSNFYDNAFFYKIYDFSSQIMIGDLKFDDNGKIVQLTKDGVIPNTVIGEFENGALQGSTYKNEEGSIGLWRTWLGKSNGGYINSNGNNTGRSTMFMPTSSISSYDGYFCVFGSFDLENESVKKTWDKIKQIFDTANDEGRYTVYYTEETGKTELTFNAIENPSFSSVTDYYKPEENEYNIYKHYTIIVPKTDNGTEARVKITKIEKIG